MTVAELNKKHNWKVPEKCPACGADFVVDDSSGTIFCPNPENPFTNKWHMAKSKPANILSFNFILEA